MQKPSLGRIVLAGVAAHENNGADVCPAVITRVWGERPDGYWTVNVRGLPDSNQNLWKTSIVLFETEEQARAYGREFGIVGACFWPPRV